MDPTTGIGNTASILSEIGTGTVARDRVVSYYTDFQASLRSLMGMLTDEDADLVLDGQIIPADQKNGAAGTYLVNEWLSEQEFVFSQLLDAYKFQQTMDSKINNIGMS